MNVCAGVDGCRAGWIAAFGNAGEMPAVAVFRHFADLLEALPGNSTVAVDMPIGLPEHCEAGGRGPERLVRPLLGMRQSSVFSIPSRAAVYALQPAKTCDAEDGWLAAHRYSSAVARQTSTPPRGVSIQAFGLFAKIREIDALLRETPALAQRVVESHPELCFWRLNGCRPLSQPKKVKGMVFAPGMSERRGLLRAAGFAEETVGMRPPPGAGEDDLLDALAVLTASRNRQSGNGLCFPDPPGRDAHGLLIAISC